MDTKSFIEYANEFLNGETAYDQSSIEDARAYAREIADALNVALTWYLHERIKAGDYY